MHLNDTDQTRGYRTNLDLLLAAQKPARGTAAYSRLVNRPLARYVAAAGATVQMTPNQATVVSAFLSGTGIVLIAVMAPVWWSGIIVALLLAAGYVMDSVDGQLARLRGSGSKSGEWLDHTVDCFKTATLHLAVLIAWFREPPVTGDFILLIPLGFEVVATVTYFGLILMPTLRPAGSIGSATGAESPLRKYVLLPTDYGVLCLAFVTFGTVLFPWIYGFLFLANAGSMVLALRKWWIELRSLDSTVRGLPTEK
ncbi:UNVERIFIED_CONTAM: CDP-alcohol phosphatidyltransferase-like enzyme [Williamsia faeni]